MSSFEQHRKGVTRAVIFVLCPVVAWVVSSCEFATGDPVHQSQVDSLGGEAPGISQGPFHRAGQPCAVCHSRQGPAKAIFSLAGTVFAGAPSTSADAFKGQQNVGVDGATVRLVDGNGAMFFAQTNCVGNFYVAPDSFDPTFPVLVAVQKGTNVSPMKSQIIREPSCAACHARVASGASPGQVYLPTSDMPSNCAVSPVTSVQ